MFQVLQGQSQAAGADVVAPLCCAQGPRLPRGKRPLNRDGLQQRTVDVGSTADQANAGATGSSTTRWKRVVSPSQFSQLSNGSGSNNTSVGVESSSSSSNGASSTDGIQSIPLCSSATPSAIITSSSISSTISASNSAQLLSTSTSLSNFTSPSQFSSCIPQTPFPSTTLTETLMTSATFPSSASPIVSSRGLTGLRSSTSTSATSFPLHSSTATVITASASTAQPSPSFTMSNSDTITLAPVNPTSIFIGPGTTQSGLDTTPIPTISTTPFIIPTFVSSTVLSPIPSTTDLLSSIASPSPFPSISAISLSTITNDDLTITATSTSTSTPSSDQSTTTSSETGALSTDTSHNTSFVHQTGAIIGVTIGGAFFVFIVALSVFFACKRRRANRSYNSSLEDILAGSRVNTSWHPPLETDDDDSYLAAYRRRTPPKYTKTSSSQGQRGPFDDPLPIGVGRSVSAESAVANGAMVEFGSKPPVPQALRGSTQSRGPPLLFPRHSNDSHGNSRPVWGPTEPLTINKLNSSQKLSPTVDSHVSPIGRRSASTLGFGGSSSSNGHRGPGSSGETLIPRGSSSNRSTFIPEPPMPVHKLGGRHYSTPPTAFVERNISLEHDTQRIQQQQEERNQEDRANKSISQVILARIRASRRSSNGSIKAYSQCTTLDSEGSTPSRTSSYMYSPSLLNPPISMSMTVVPQPRGGVSRSSYGFPSQQFISVREDITSSSRGPVRWPDVGTLPPPPPPLPLPSSSAPSLVPTDTSSMVEGLLHPRLGMGLGSSQQASATSLRDHEDYTRPINGLVNNHLRSTTTFETQNTVDLSEGGT